MKSCAVLVSILLISSWIITAAFSIHFQYQHKVAEPFHSFDFLYDKPWQRFGPYTMGILAGFALNHFKQPPKISKILNLFLWILSVGIMFAIIFGVWEGQLNVKLTSVYVSLGHTGLSWCFFCNRINFHLKNLNFYYSLGSVAVMDNIVLLLGIFWSC